VVKQTVQAWRVALLSASCGAVLGSSAVAAVPAPRVVSVDPASVPSGTYRLDHDHSHIVWSVSVHGYSIFTAPERDVIGRG
jgi:hypothetical protein